MRAFSSKHTLYASRVAALQPSGLERHVALFNRLRVQDMSADEADGSPPQFPPTYRIIRAKWQSSALRSFLRALDAKYLRLREQPGGRWITPRIRVEGVEDLARVEDRPPPPPVGLWRNCYDQEWLQGLGRDELDALHIMDDDYDFDLTAQAPANGQDVERMED